MLSFQDLLNEVNQLDRDQLDELMAHIEKRRKEEWAAAFDAAVDALQEGLSSDEVRELQEAMNADYIEDVDLDQWRD